MPLEREAIESALTRKGFERKEDGDHRKFHFWTTDSKKTAVWTKTSRGTKYKVLSDELVGLMAKQLKLTRKDFLRFVECELSRAQYERKLSEQGAL